MNHRLVRKLHLWIGAWGAIAAIIFGTSGFLQNHRGVMKLPQGESTEVSRIEAPVPEAARVSQDAMRAWLTDTQHTSIDVPRVQGNRPPEGRRRADPNRPNEGTERRERQPMRWTFSGGNARHTLQAEYIPGSDSITLRSSVQSPLAVLSRLHKGIGGGIAWILLSDSFALGMIALGVSGLLMWARGRTVRQVSLSIVGAAALVLLIIGGIAVD